MNIRGEGLKRVIIIALSALITESVTERGKACGFDDFSKDSILIWPIVETPITPEHIKNKIFAKLEARQTHEILLLSQIEDEEHCSPGQEEVSAHQES